MNETKDDNCVNCRSDSLLLTNATIVLPDKTTEGDILIENGVFKEIIARKPRRLFDREEDSRPIKTGDILDLDRAMIFPGCIDLHVHFRDPGSTDKEDFATGTKAAVAGGITTIVDMPNTTPPVLDRAILELKRQETAQKAHCDYGFFAGIADGKNQENWSAADNIAGLKVFFGASTGGLALTDRSLLEKTFRDAAPLTIFCHCESDRIISSNAKYYQGMSDLPIDVHQKIRDVRSAVDALKSCLAMAKRYGTKVHICHVSTPDELDLINAERQKGLMVTCEVTPHHLLLDQSLHTRLHNFVKVNPPLRDLASVLVLKQAFLDGKFDCLSSDHAPHTRKEKEQDYWQAPAGIPSIELSLRLMLTLADLNSLPYQLIAKYMAESPAEILGLGNKGAIIAGNDADFSVLIAKKSTIARDHRYITKCGWSPYRGFPLHWEVRQTYVRGRIVHDQGTFPPPLGREIEFRTN